MQWYGCNLPFRPTPLGEFAWFPYDTLPPVPSEHDYSSVSNLATGVETDVEIPGVKWHSDQAPVFCTIHNVQFAADSDGVYVHQSEPKKYVETLLSNFLYRLDKEYQLCQRSRPHYYLTHVKYFKNDAYLKHYVDLFFKTLTDLTGTSPQPPLPQILYRQYRVRSCTKLNKNWRNPYSIKSFWKEIECLIVKEDWAGISREIGYGQEEGQFEEMRLQLKQKLNGQADKDTTLENQINTMETLLVSLKEKKRKRDESKVNADDDIYQFLKMLTEWDTSKQESYSVIVFPYYWTPSETCPSVFDYLESEHGEHPLLPDILKFRPYFKGKITSVKIDVYGKKKGYKGRDTMFTKLYGTPTDGIDFVDLDANAQILYAWYGEEPPNHFEFFAGDCLDTDADSDWGDWDSTYVTGTHTTELYYIKMRK